MKGISGSLETGNRWSASKGQESPSPLDTEVYGIEILKIQEIITAMSITRVPRMPEFVRGVINLRGKVIPVVDLRLQFGLGAHQDTQRTGIIVLDALRADGPVTLGVIVDEVSEVLYIKDDQIEPRASFGIHVETDFLLGIGKVREKVVMLLDMNRVLSADEVTTVSRMA